MRCSLINQTGQVTDSSLIEIPYRLVLGDSEIELGRLPTGIAHCCITSPPYWNQRSYDSRDGLGNETDPQDYVNRLVRIFRGVRRVLRPDGSLWLNLGDTYRNKNLMGIPWRVALALQADGWILRNSIIWDKVKGNPCNSKDKLRNVHELVFHFVAMDTYYYDLDAIRNEPGKPTWRNGRIVTATGVNGSKYERQIRRSTELNELEKANALQALKETLAKVEHGELPDFRMIIRGTQRATHSDSLDFSGRANELKAKGFCILPYHKNGTKPGDVWQITPEDEWRKEGHYAVFPRELCELPIKATCPAGGIVLDPFVGTGTALVAALEMGRRGIGIDLSASYLEEAARRLEDTARSTRCRPIQPRLELVWHEAEEPRNTPKSSMAF
jgi:DNA modification methylase